MVEMAMILPLLLLLVLGMLEFGIAFDHNLTLEYATREGARTGAALANGGGKLGCLAGQSPNAAKVDPAIIEAVQRVLTSEGSPLDVSEVSQIRIYKANSSGREVSPAQVDRWIYAGPGLGDFGIDGVTRLDFRADPLVQSWPACSRSNGVTPDSVGVSLVYHYAFQTPLGALLSLVEINMHDHTVMSLNPTNK
jgi:hypothetical protein